MEDRRHSSTEKRGRFVNDSNNVHKYENGDDDHDNDDDHEPSPKRVKTLIKHFEKTAFVNTTTHEDQQQLEKPSLKMPPPKSTTDTTTANLKKNSSCTSASLPVKSGEEEAEQRIEQNDDNDLVPPKPTIYDATTTVQSTSTATTSTTTTQQQQQPQDDDHIDSSSSSSSIQSFSISSATEEIDVVASTTIGIDEEDSSPTDRIRPRKVRFSSANDIKTFLVWPDYNNDHPQYGDHSTAATATATTARIILSKSTGAKLVRILVWAVGTVLFASAFLQQPATSAPSSLLSNDEQPRKVADITLRDFLVDPNGFHLGMAPAFFGFYGYFGSLAAWEEQLSNTSFNLFEENLHSVAGASAGAMAAVLLAAGVPPRKAADFCTTITLGEFADFPGLLSLFKGNKFQDTMTTFLKQQKPNSTLQLQDAKIPVAVSGFDLQTLEGKLLSQGNMARAARASACFPFLFQPVGWMDGNDNYLLIDGGLRDMAGLNGLGAFEPQSEDKRVVNLVVGDFLGPAPGPSSMPEGVIAKEVLSVSLLNLPQCGPWAMESGPLAVEGAIQAMAAALDQPLLHGDEDGHYLLPIDASTFVPTP